MSGADERPGTGDGPSAEALDAGVTHLRTAALELISAGRHFLDAAERAVAGGALPDDQVAQLHQWADVGRSFVEGLLGPFAPPSPSGPSGPGGPAGPDDDFHDVPVE